MDLLTRVMVGMIPAAYILFMIYYAANRKCMVDSPNFSAYNVVILWLPKLIHVYHTINATYFQYDGDSDVAGHLGINIRDGYIYKSKSTILFCHVVEYPLYLIWYWFHTLRIKIHNGRSRKVESMNEFNHLYKNAKNQANKSK